MSYGTAKLTSVIGFIPVLSILYTKYVKCVVILPGNWCKCVWFDMFLRKHVSFNHSELQLPFSLEALKKSVEQRQELDDAIDQCEQAPLRDVSGQISLQ